MKITWEDPGWGRFMTGWCNRRIVASIRCSENGLYWPEVYIGPNTTLRRMSNPFNDIGSAKRWVARWHARLQEFGA